MSPQHFGNLLHRFDFGSHGSCAPGIKEFASPSRRTVTPESLKIFLEQVGADGSEVACEQIFKPIHLLFSQIFRPFQETPTALCQEGLFPFFLQFFGLIGPDLVDCLAHVTHDMKPVEDIDCTRRLFGNDGQIGFPHVAANKPQLPRPCRAEPVEKFPESFGCTVGTDPKKASLSLVKLVHKGDKLILAFAPADFVDANGRDPINITMCESPIDRHFHRPEDCVPTGFKDFGHFLPTQSLAPSGEKPGVRECEVAFSYGPRQLFDLDATGWALHTPWGVEEIHRYSPQGNKGKSSDAQIVIPGSPFAALRADGFAADLGPQCYHQCWRSGISPCARVIDKTRLFFDTVQDSLNVHPV